MNFHLQLWRKMSCRYWLSPLANRGINRVGNTGCYGFHCVANTLKEARRGTRYLRALQACGVLSIGSGVETIRDWVVQIHHVVNIVRCKTSVGSCAPTNGLVVI